MSIHRSVRAIQASGHKAKSLAVASALLLLIGFLPASAQSASAEADTAPCTLKNHIYTCNSAALEKVLSPAKTISFETHNADGIARRELTNLVENKLHKTLVPDGQPADLVFLLMPSDDSGQVENNSTVQDLGSLRIYSTTPTGERDHLLWAQTYTGEHDLPWPLIARGIVSRFEKQFHIK